MVFPKRSRELKEIFRHAAPPDIARLKGEYLVDMLTLWPSFKRFSHRKIIYTENQMTVGYNVLFNKVWGHFKIEEGNCRDIDSASVVVINYNRATNTALVRGIRDHIRCVERDIFIGRFNYLFMGRLQFLGYFSLEKLITVESHKGAKAQSISPINRPAAINILL